jgi:hypothetical protein
VAPFFNASVFVAFAVMRFSSFSRRSVNVSAAGVPADEVAGASLEAVEATGVVVAVVLGTVVLGTVVLGTVVLVGVVVDGVDGVEDVTAGIVSMPASSVMSAGD